MPKGEHFRKYHSKEKLDEVFSLRVNSNLFAKLRQIVENPQEWLRAMMRKKVKEIQISSKNKEKSK